MTIAGETERLRETFQQVLNKGRTRKLLAAPDRRIASGWQHLECQYFLGRIGGVRLFPSD